MAMSVVRVKYGNRSINFFVESHYSESDDKDLVRARIQANCEEIVELYRQFAASFQNLTQQQSSKLRQQYDGILDKLRAEMQAHNLGLQSAEEAQPAQDKVLSADDCRRIRKRMYLLCACPFYHDEVVQRMQSSRIEYMLSHHTKKASKQCLTDVGYSVIDHKRLGKELKQMFHLKQPCIRISLPCKPPIPESAVSVCPRVYRLEDGERRSAYLVGYGASRKPKEKIVFPDGKTKIVRSDALLSIQVISRPVVGSFARVNRKVYVKWHSHFFVLDKALDHIHSTVAKLPDWTHVLEPWQLQCTSWEQRAVAAVKHGYKSSTQPLASWIAAVGSLSSGSSAPQLYDVATRLNERHVMQLFAQALALHPESEPCHRRMWQRLIFDAGLTFVQCDRPYGKRARHKRHAPVSTAQGAVFSHQPDWTGAGVGINCCTPWCLPKPRKKRKTDEPDYDSDDELLRELEDSLDTQKSGSDELEDSLATREAVAVLDELLK